MRPSPVRCPQARRLLVAILLLIAFVSHVRAQDPQLDPPLPAMPDGITYKDCVTICDTQYRFIGRRCVKVRMTNERIAPLPMVMGVVLQASPTALDRFQTHVHSDHSHMLALVDDPAEHALMRHIGPDDLAKARAALCQCQGVDDAVEVMLRENTKTPIYKNSDIIAYAGCSGKCKPDRVAHWKQKYPDPQ